MKKNFRILHSILGCLSIYGAGRLSSQTILVICVCVTVCVCARTCVRVCEQCISPVIQILWKLERSISMQYKGVKIKRILDSCFMI